MIPKISSNLVILCEFHTPTFFLPAFYLPVITSHLMFDTGARSHLCLFEACSLPEELALVHHYPALYVAIYTQIPTHLQRALVSSVNECLESTSIISALLLLPALLQMGRFGLISPWDFHCSYLSPCHQGGTVQKDQSKCGKCVCGSGSEDGSITCIVWEGKG